MLSVILLCLSFFQLGDKKLPLKARVELLIDQSQVILKLPLNVSDSRFHFQSIVYGISINLINLRINWKIDSPEAPYWIADTDYTNYAIVVSCSDLFGLFRVGKFSDSINWMSVCFFILHIYFIRNYPFTDSIWILSRTPDLPQSTMDALHSYVDRLGLSSSALSRVDQSNCPNWN